MQPVHDGFHPHGIGVIERLDQQRQHEQQPQVEWHVACGHDHRGKQQVAEELRADRPTGLVPGNGGRESPGVGQGEIQHKGGGRVRLGQLDAPQQDQQAPQQQGQQMQRVHPGQTQPHEPDILGAIPALAEPALVNVGQNESAEHEEDDDAPVALADHIVKPVPGQPIVVMVQAHHQRRVPPETGQCLDVLHAGTPLDMVQRDRIHRRAGFSNP